jgi:thiol-disulfide isomerase/thioredoxin
LEFWGYWCGPCVGGMPELFALDDKYRDRGLVIIGIHLDMSAFDQPAVDTAAKLDELLLDTRKDLWAGRDIPFPVALVASKPTPFRAGLAQKSPSAASALYGVTGVPTQVLIDRHGNVVGRFSANGEGIQLLEKLIQEK